MKTLNDFKTYVEKKAQHDKASADLRELRSEREHLVTTLRESIAKQGNDINARAAMLLQGDYVNSEPLKQQIQEIDLALPVYERAVRLTEIELEHARSAASHAICQAERPKFVTQIQRIVAALNEIADANSEINKLRSDLESQNIRTGSIPVCNFLAIGNSQDHRLQQSRMAIYIQEIKKHFSEVK